MKMQEDTKSTKATARAREESAVRVEGVEMSVRGDNLHWKRAGWTS